MAITIDGTDGLTTDNAALKLDGTTLAVDDTNNRVGIGTSSPTRLLTLSTTDYAPLLVKHTDGGGAYISFMDNATTDDTEVLAGAVGNNFAVHAGDTERMRLDSTGNLKFNSGFGSVGTAYGVRAWVNFNGTGTVAIRASGNVSSVSDLGTGKYRINMTNAMPDTNYAVVMYNNAASGSAYTSFSNQYTGGLGDLTTSKFDVASYVSGYTDSLRFNCVVLR